MEVSASACGMYREKIEADLRRGRNAMGIWQDLVDRHGFAGGYQSVRRFVRVLRGRTLAGQTLAGQDSGGTDGVTPHPTPTK